MLGFGFGPSRACRRRGLSGTPAPAPFTAVAADGWQATVTSPSDLSLLPASVSRQGFDAAGAATTHVETLYLTKRVRQAWPNHASLTANSQALSDYVYSTDTIAGVTNSSAETSPMPVANWVMPHRLVVGNAVELEVVAFHRNARAGKQVACVIFRATDGTTTVTQTVAAPAVSGRTGDRCAVVTYKASLDISALNNNALITCDAEVYPWIGAAGSVLDSADSSVARELSPRHFLKHTTLAASPPYAYVSTSGNDGTGVVSTTAATAAASPFLTVVGAMNGIHTALSATTGMDGAEIRIGNDGGTPFVLTTPSATRTHKCGALTITRDPNVARANARVSFGAAAFSPRLAGALISPLATGALRFKDLAIVRAGGQGINGDNPPFLELILDDCDFDNGSQGFVWLTRTHDYHFGTTFTNLTGGVPLAASTYEHRLLRGVSLQAASGTTVEAWLIVGSDILRPSALSVGASRTASGSIIAFNKLKSPSSATLINIAGTADVAGVAIVQNLFEWTTVTSGHDIGIANDSAAGDASHAILHNNTFAGAFNAGRVNLFYDEGSTPRVNKLHSVKGNIFVSVNTKSDVFRGASEGNPEGFNGGSPSTRIGNWAFENGVGCAGNFSQFIDAQSGGIGGSFAQEYPGLNASFGASSTVRNDPLFTTYAGATYNGSYTAGAGGGDYTLQGGSTCLGRLADAVLSHNLAGTARPASNDNAGAY